ncbi:MAG: hypothetical protein ACYDG4_16635 [Desulfuromonadaceae bacterium]
MGSPKRLKKKDELHYRKGSTNESSNCRWCVHFVESITLFRDKGNIEIGSRCQIIGLAQSIRYRVREDHTCDVQRTTCNPPR